MMLTKSDLLVFIPLLFFLIVFGIMNTVQLLVMFDPSLRGMEETQMLGSVNGE